MTTSARWNDERGLVGKMMVVLLLIIVVLGLAAVETASIIFAKLSLENTVSAAVADGARDLGSSHSQTSACQTAAATVKEQDDKAVIVVCQANPATGQIFIKLRKTAPTLIVRRVGFLRKLGVVKANAETGPGAE